MGCHFEGLSEVGPAMLVLRRTWGLPCARAEAEVGPAMLVLRPHLRELDVPLEACPAEGRHPRAVAGVDEGSHCDELSRGLNISVPRCVVQGRPLVALVGCVDVSASGY